MKARTIGILMLIVTVIGVGWNIFGEKSAKAKTTQEARNNIVSPVAQASNHSITSQTVNNSLVNVTVVAPDKTKQLEAQGKSQNQALYPNRPKVVVVNPSVTFVNYTDDIQKGLVKAGFDIPFVNIGGVDAKGLATKWGITDNGDHRTGLDEWLTKFLHQENMVIQSIPSGTATSIFYNPDIAAIGVGTIELNLDYEYSDAITGQKYTDQYKGMVDYRTEKNNKPKRLLLTPR